MKKFSFILVALFVLLGVTSCNNDSDYEELSELDCSDAMCTDNMLSIGVRTFYEDGTPALLDSYVVKTKSGKTWCEERNEEINVYRLVSDAYDYDKLFCRKWELYAIGKIDGKIVMAERYVVTADCCHVKLLEGNLKVVIKK